MVDSIIGQLDAALAWWDGQDPKATPLTPASLSQIKGSVLSLRETLQSLSEVQEKLSREDERNNGSG